jgi:hypothetical protein
MSNRLNKKVCQDVLPGIFDLKKNNLPTASSTNY